MHTAVGGNLLGPVRLDINGRPVTVASRRSRLVLAALIARAGRITGVDRLADIIWRGSPPRTWTVQLQTCVMELRRAIEAAGHPCPREVLTTVGQGYRLCLSPGCLDVDRFRAAAAEARAVAAADPAGARRLYLLAEALCAGRALDDVRDYGLEAEATALDELLHGVRLDRLALDVECGAAAEAIAELRALTTAYPWQERPHALLMTALWRERRGVEALDHFHRVRRDWVAQLGIEPGEEIVALQRRILLAGVETPLTGTVPRELPPAPAPLIGRADTKKVVIEALTAADRTGPAVVCLYGPPGTGTTSVAVAAAHAVTDAFPDGQVYLGLRRPDRTEIPVDDLIAHVLRSLGGPEPIPADTDRRAALLRTLTTDRRLLIVADDAAQAAQVRAILPAAAGCAVLVTAIRPLLGLDRAQHIQVQPLAPADAADLLTTAAGRPLAADADRDAILESCAGSPLALRIVGARLSLRPASEVVIAARALASDDHRLDYLVAGDLAVRQGLRLAHAECGAAARQVLRTLAWLPTADAAAWLLAAAAGSSDIEAATAASELLDVGLLMVAAWEPVPRFALHGLVRSFARELEPLDPAAIARMVVAGADLARRADAGLRHGMTPPPSGREADQAAVAAVLPAIDRDGPAFLAAEAATLAGLVLAGAAIGSDPDPIARLALALNGYLTVHDYRRAREDVLSTAAAPGDRLDPVLYARLLLALFAARAQAAADNAELTALADRVVRATEVTGEVPMRIAAQRMLTIAWRNAGRSDAALEAAGQALALCDDDPDLAGERASLRCTQAALLCDLGRIGEALAMSLRAAYDEGLTPDRRRAVILANTAEVALDAGAVDIADRALDEAEGIVDDIGDALGQANIGFIRARADGVRGAHTTARERMAAAHTLLAGHEDPSTLRLVRLIEAELAARRGHAAAADREVAAVIAEADRDCDAICALRARQVEAMLRAVASTPTAAAS